VTALVLLYGWVPLAGAAVAVPIARADVVASATGTVLHAGLLQSAGSKLVDAEVAFTGAAYDSTGFARSTFNEMQRKLVPAAAKKLTYGRAVGIEAGLAATPDKPNQLLLAGLAEIAAPVGGLVRKQVGPLDLDPLAWANLLASQSSAASPGDRCVIGSNLSSSLAYVGDAQLLATGASRSGARTTSSAAATQPKPANPVEQVTNQVRSGISKLTGKLAGAAPAPVAKILPKPQSAAASASAPASAEPMSAEVSEGLIGPVVSIDADRPARAVSFSRSRTVMVGQRGRDGKLLGHDFGVMSEIRQTIAPVTLFRGTPFELTLEFLGEWVLQSVATGVPGGAYVHYGPGRTTPSTPVIRMISDGVTDILTLQDLLGDKGLVIKIPGIAEIAIGEDARAIGGDADTAPAVAANGTSAAAAVDVVRVSVLPGAPAQLTDVRIGHMEAASSVPAGGVACPLGVKKTPATEDVSVGDTFDVDMMVSNPYDCTIHNVVLTDEITSTKDARFDVLSTTPKAIDVPSGADIVDGKIVWRLGDLAPHTAKKVTASFEALGGAGVISDEATATGIVGTCAQPGAIVGGVGVSAVDARLTGASPHVAIDVEGGEVSVLGAGKDRAVPLTGAPIAMLALIGLCLLAAGGAARTLAYRFRSSRSR
jgi:hypothetical protein